MLQLPERSLPATTAHRLRAYQKQIDDLTDYAERVKQTETKFKARNTTRNATFRQVRDTLTEMCFGSQRCGYCEDSAAVEIDHHKPKTLYPESVFVWENYVYSCGACNRPKLDNYAVFPTTENTYVSVTRLPKAPISPPLSGDVAFIDPRHENPLEFMRLDLLDTFQFLPLGQPTSRNHQRAKYTIEKLQLNTRPYLPLARKQAYQGYLSHVHRYIRWRGNEKFAERLHEPIEAIVHENHLTVWAEMKRQRHLIPDLNALFAEAPEALNW